VQSKNGVDLVLRRVLLEFDPDREEVLADKGIEQLRCTDVEDKERLMDFFSMFVIMS